MTDLDHYQLVLRTPTELAKFYVAFDPTQTEEFEVDVIHLPNYRCCKMEAWDKTVEILMKDRVAEVSHSPQLQNNGQG